jgi:hypothetical protein
VILPAAPRRPSRVVAVALLLALHLVAIDLIVHLQTTRDRIRERLTSLRLLDAPPKAVPVERTPPAAQVQPPRPLLAPLPPADVEPPLSIHDSATPVATAEAAASAPGAAASAPGPAKLDLTIPRTFFTQKEPPPTPAQEAMRDPRSNRLVLTRQEKMDLAFGGVECIAWQREPDGSIYRGPGHYRRVPGLSANPFTSHAPGKDDHVQECVK